MGLLAGSADRRDEGVHNAQHADIKEIISICTVYMLINKLEDTVQMAQLPRAVGKSHLGIDSQPTCIELQALQRDLPSHDMRAENLLMVHEQTSFKKGQLLLNKWDFSERVWKCLDRSCQTLAQTYVQLSYRLLGTILCRAT